MLSAPRHPTPTLQVDRFPNPFKIQHHVNCSVAPTLELPLHTTVSGALTIASGPTWTDLAAALQVAMGFKAVGPGVCTGTATLTQTADVTHALSELVESEVRHNMHDIRTCFAGS